MKKNIKLTREIYPVISNQWGSWLRACSYFSPDQLPTAMSFSWVSVIASEQIKMFSLESQYMLHTEKWSSVLSSSRAPWTCLFLRSRTLRPITSPCFLPCRTYRDSSYFPLFSAAGNYTGWLQVDSRASGIYSLWSFLKVLIILLSLVFYRLQIWLNEAMGTFGGEEQKNHITYCLNNFLTPIDLWWLKECTQHSAWNIISAL